MEKKQLRRSRSSGRKRIPCWRKLFAKHKHHCHVGTLIPNTKTFELKEKGSFEDEEKTDSTIIIVVCGKGNSIGTTCCRCGTVVQERNAHATLQESCAKLTAVTALESVPQKLSVSSQRNYGQIS